MYRLFKKANTIYGDFMEKGKNIEQKMPLTKEDYKTYADKKADKSNLLKDCIMAFLIGGLICCIGQGIVEICKYFGLDKDAYSAISTIILIFLGAFLTSLGLYNNIGKHAGAGSIVPITGFSNSVVSPAIEYKSEGYILGVGANMFKIAGPVLVYGICSSTIAGFIYFLYTTFMR